VSGAAIEEREEAHLGGVFGVHRYPYCCIGGKSVEVGDGKSTDGSEKGMGKDIWGSHSGVAPKESLRVVASIMNKAEIDFTKVAAAYGWKSWESSKDQNIKGHIDIICEKGGHTRTVDVKAPKSLRREPNEPQDKIFLIELQSGSKYWKCPKCAKEHSWRKDATRPLRVDVSGVTVNECTHCHFIVSIYDKDEIPSQEGWVFGDVRWIAQQLKNGSFVVMWREALAVATLELTDCGYFTIDQEYAISQTFNGKHVPYRRREAWLSKKVKNSRGIEDSIVYIPRVDLECEMRKYHDVRVGEIIYEILRKNGR